MFKSSINQVGVLAFPDFSGTRVMMMPFILEDAATIPPMLERYRRAIETLAFLAPVKSGVAYLTIDEATVEAGEHHRRPGLHVDGVGAWGKGGGGWGATGFLLASSAIGCRGWSQIFNGAPNPDGDCAHLADQRGSACELVMQPGAVYCCSPLAVHESMPMRERTRRQFVRLSMPSDAPWFEGYTENPLGVKPTGPVLPRRAEEMSWRP